MKKVRIVVRWLIIVTFLLPAPFAAAKNQKRFRHKRNEVWNSCTPNTPVIDLAKAFTEGIAQQRRTGQPCPIKHQEGRWPFRHATLLDDKRLKR